MGSLEWKSGTRLFSFSSLPQQSFRGLCCSFLVCRTSGRRGLLGLSCSPVSTVRSSLGFRCCSRHSGLHLLLLRSRLVLGCHLLCGVCPSFLDDSRVPAASAARLPAPAWQPRGHSSLCCACVRDDCSPSPGTSVSWHRHKGPRLSHTSAISLKKYSTC